jgi:hypothetical protein
MNKFYLPGHIITIGLCLRRTLILHRSMQHLNALHRVYIKKAPRIAELEKYSL